MRDQLEQLRAECFRMLHNINSNIGQIVTYPTRHVNPQENLMQEYVDNAVAPTAVLKNHPQDLYELWIEYTTGLEGISQLGYSMQEKEAVSRINTLKGKSFGILLHSSYTNRCVMQCCD